MDWAQQTHSLCSSTFVPVVSIDTTFPQHWCFFKIKGGSIMSASHNKIPNRNCDMHLSATKTPCLTKRIRPISIHLSCVTQLLQKTFLIRYCVLFYPPQISLLFSSSVCVCLTTIPFDLNKRKPRCWNLDFESVLPFHIVISGEGPK